MVILMVLVIAANDNSLFTTITGDFYKTEMLLFSTLVVPSSETRIQRRVLPELTEPPSLVNNVCSLMLNVECVISTVLSKTTCIAEKSCGTLCRSLVVYLVVVHGVSHVNFRL